MATVYLAEDLKHGRKVAIKVLHPELSAVIGGDRFLAEIKVTANLQHPHILGLIDSGEADGLLYYVMPFVAGESLRNRLTRDKQLPIDDALRLAKEVASALDYAHRQGVVHRDIKPENILLQDGNALVADFGIALAVQQAGGSRMTQTGMSLGTPAYMSPEQAMGERDIGARSDVYALGAMTYEMLTGEPPFTGLNSQAIVAKVLTETPPPLRPKRPTVSPAVEHAVLTALQKLPADRYGSAKDFADALDGKGNYSPTVALSSRPHALTSSRPGRALVTIAVFALISALALWGWLRPSNVREQPPSRLAIIAPELGGTSTALQRQIALTPSGTTLLYTAIVNGENLTMRRDLDASEAVPVPGVPPFLAGYSVSQDGQEFVGYVDAAGAYYRFPLSGGSGVALPGEFGKPQDVAWAADGSIWFAGAGSIEQGIGRLSPDNVITRPLGKGDVSLVPQQVLPGDRAALMIRRPFGSSAGPVVLLDLASGESRTLVNVDVVQVFYTSGYLVYAQTNGAIDALPFDERRHRVSGRPVTVATGVSLSGTGVAQFAVSANGTVAYIPEADRSLVLIERNGAVRPAATERHNFHSPRFSPDGRRIAVDFTTIDGRDVWLTDLATGGMTRATFNRDGHDASWEPGGRSLTFISATKGVLGIRRVSPGSTEPAESLLASPTVVYTGIWLHDGSAIVTAASSLVPGSRADIAIVRNAGRGPVEPLVATRFDEWFPAVSPDGRWLAFVSNQSGKNEVYARPLDGKGEQVQVSMDGGTEPVWGPGGGEIFYRGGPTTAPKLITAGIETRPGLSVTSRRELFSVAEMATATPHANYDVSPDGRTFVMVRNNPSTRIMVIQNLPALVAKERGGAATTP